MSSSRRLSVGEKVESTKEACRAYCSPENVLDIRRAQRGLYIISMGRNEILVEFDNDSLLVLENTAPTGHAGEPAPPITVILKRCSTQQF